jgi:hypothetical protein
MTILSLKVLHVIPCTILILVGKKKFHIWWPKYIWSKFLLYLECYLLSLKMHKKVSKSIKQSKKHISITKKSDTSITVIVYVSECTVNTAIYSIYNYL